MRYLLELTQKQEYGQIPVANENNKIQYIIQGNLDNPNHTLYLKKLMVKKSDVFIPMAMDLFLPTQLMLSTIL